MSFPLVKLDDLFDDAISNPIGIFVEIKRQWEIAIKSRLDGQIERIRRWAISAKLSENNCKLLITKWCDFGKYNLDYISPINGDSKDVNPTIWSWNREKLSKFKGNIPNEILEQLPENAGKKAYVFTGQVDPIIAIKVNRNEYIAIWQWD